MICTISVEKDDDVSSSQHPSPIRHILCGICLSGSHHILWMDIGHHSLPTCRLLVFQTSRHILFRFVKMGAHDNTNFCDRKFVWGGATLPLCSRPPGSVAQCPGDTSLVIIPFARDHKTPAQDPTQPRHMAAAQHRSGNQFGQLPPNPRCCSVVHNGQ